MFTFQPLDVLLFQLIKLQSFKNLSILAQEEMKFMMKSEV
jgi:hypothetical protein